MATQKTLVWFRQDLRLNDNPALSYASNRGEILPVYILDKTHAREYSTGSASRWWLHHALNQLNKSLQGKLRFFAGDPLTLIPELLASANIRKITWNRCYEPWQIHRDQTLKQRLQQQNIHVESFNGQLLWEPWQVLKKDGSPYRVFTPYYRKGCLQQHPRMPLPAPKELRFYPGNIDHMGLEKLQLLPKICWYKGLEATWQPGEANAGQRLSQFLKSALHRYQINRNVPAIQGTSKLSPHLHFGELSPNQIWYAALHTMEGNAKREDLDCFLSELAWREFSYYLLYHFPALPEQNLQTKFDHFPWRSDKQALEAWQQGQTGIPIVDAGMRELWQTGYMHNRVRMIVASFLVKNLLLHWRHGAAWFWDCLVDADLASNSASWQWVAGSGADAAPYFRIFNPVTQGKKFDPEGVYVKRYCPELTTLPTAHIHNPWEAPKAVLATSGVTLGKQYPKPIVDLKASRQRALEAFKQIKDH